MKPFRSSLEALLTLRKRTEQEALEEYAKQLLERARALEELDSVEERLRRIRQELAEELERGGPAQRLHHLRRFYQSVESDCRRCQNAVETVNGTIQRSLEKLMAARRQREAVETFEEQQRREHRRGQEREELKLIDEMVNRKGLLGSIFQSGQESRN